jgi:hypothetical protein
MPVHQDFFFQFKILKLNKWTCILDPVKSLIYFNIQAMIVS